MRPVIFALALCILSLGLLLVAQSRFETQKFGAPRDFQELQRIWSEDLRQLDQAKALPSLVHDVAHWTVIPPSNPSSVYEESQYLKWPLELNSYGKHRVEVLAIKWSEGVATGVILQMKFLEEISGNLVFEMGRTYVLNGNPNLADIKDSEDETEPYSPGRKHKSNPD